jgi:poly-gamma-glutamate synthesis protein (capsule biosynthesis protein)
VRTGRAIAALLMLGATCSASSAQTRPPVGIYFRDACVPGERVTIAAVGDLLFHFNLQQQALAKTSSFARLWEPVRPILRRADLVYGNLEGPAARAVMPGGMEMKLPAGKDDRSYDRRFYAGGEGGVLVFNFHPSVVADLKAGGFDIVSTANNHAADRGPLGIERTIDALEAVKLVFTGTRRRGETAQDRSWSTVTNAKGFAIAWLACTFSTNGMPDPHAQVLACFGPRGEPSPQVLDEIRRLAARPDVDAVILTPHWGNEYQQQPDASQRRLAHEAIDAGAAAVIGSHPHVLQPWEQYVTADGREGLIVYSSGNFISSQLRTEQRSGLISLLELTRDADGRARLTAAGYVPTWVDFASPWRVLENTGTESAAALALTTRLLPPANRVRSGALGQLPKACLVQMVEGTTSPTNTKAVESDSQDTTGAIAAPQAQPIKVRATAATLPAPRPKSQVRAPVQNAIWAAGTAR